MIVTAGQLVTRTFTVRAGGIAIDGDDTPTGLLIENGEISGQVVTIASLGITGVYTAQVTIPGDASQFDNYDCLISTSIDGNDYNGVIWAATVGSDGDEVGSFSEAALQQLAANGINVNQPIGASQAVTIVAGMDYSHLDGRSLNWTDPSGNWPSLTGATITVEVRRKSENITKTFTGSVVSATQVRLQLTDTQTADFSIGEWTYGVKATLSGGNVVDLVGPKRRWEVATLA